MIRQIDKQFIPYTVSQLLLFLTKLGLMLPLAFKNEKTASNLKKKKK